MVHPLLTKKEMINRFIITLQAPYYENLERSFLKNFKDAIILCGRIDEAMKNGLRKKVSLGTKGKKGWRLVSNQNLALKLVHL